MVIRDYFPDDLDYLDDEEYWNLFDSSWDELMSDDDGTTLWEGNL